MARVGQVVYRLGQEGRQNGLAVLARTSLPLLGQEDVQRQQAQGLHQQLGLRAQGAGAGFDFREEFQLEELREVGQQSAWGKIHLRPIPSGEFYLAIEFLDAFGLALYARDCGLVPKFQKLTTGPTFASGSRYRRFGIVA